MKKGWGAILTVVCIALVIGSFYFVANRNTSTASEDLELTEVQKVITKDLSKNYPATPREVVKTYNQIIACFYNEEYSEDELYRLGDQARLLFDEELLENNPRDEYFENLQAEIDEFAELKKTIASSNVCSSNEVEFKTIDGDECAYVQASYFVKEGSTGQYSRTYQTYGLRKDENGNWKILLFYQTGGTSNGNERN